MDCDVLVVGAGPAGLAAACAAAESGARVVVLDQSPWAGGQIWRGEESAPGGSQQRAWRRRFRESGARLCLRTTALAAPRRNVLLAEAPDGPLEIDWRSLVLATGARELFLPFPGWTLPGVLGPGGLHAMARSGWPVAGRKVVVAGSGPLLLAAAHGLKAHGARIRLIAEQAPWRRLLGFGASLGRHPGKLLQGLSLGSGLWGAPYRAGAWPVRAQGADRLESVTLTTGARSWTEPCDYLACAFHLEPNLELPLLLGCRVEEDRVRVDSFQETSVVGVFCAGEPTGIGGADCALAEGEIAGLAAAERRDQAKALFGRRAAWTRFRDSLRVAFALRPELRLITTPETIVCRCEDVTRRDMESQDHWRAAKLQARCGMGACQGRVCGAAARFLFGWEREGTRPPVFPASVGSLAGLPHTNPTVRPNPQGCP